MQHNYFTEKKDWHRDERPHSRIIENHKALKKDDTNVSTTEKHLDDRSKSKIEQLTLADLDSEYEKWLRKNTSTVLQSKDIELIDPFSGENVSKSLNRRRFTFAIDFDTVKIKQVDDRSIKKTEQPP